MFNKTTRLEEIMVKSSTACVRQALQFLSYFMTNAIWVLFLVPYGTNLLF